MAEKTDHFASLVKTTDQLPRNLQGIHDEITGTYGQSRVSLYAPPLNNLPAKDQPNFTGCLLAIFDGSVIAGFDSDVDRPKSLEIPFDDIISLEIGNILLYSWFTIFFGTHHCRDITIPFNTVTELFFRNVLFLIREKLDVTIKDNFQPKTLTQADLPLKFLNALQQCLIPDEKIIEYAFQPEIRSSHLIFFNEQVAPPFLAAITDRQMLIIVEEEATSRVPVEKYGETYHYCPITRFEDLGVTPDRTEKHLSEFRVSLVNEYARQTIGSLLGAEFEPEFVQLTERMKAVVSEAN